MTKPPLHPSGTPGPVATTAPATREKLNARAHELAASSGRVPAQVTQSEYEQAKRELTGESEGERQDAVLDAMAEPTQWNPVPGSVGHQAPESPSEDEDDEGRSETEQLVDDGQIAAERDRAHQSDASDKAGDREPSVDPHPHPAAHKTSTAAPSPTPRKHGN